MPSAGGDPQVLTTPADRELLHEDPVVLPGGQGVLFVATNDEQVASVFVLDLESGDWQELAEGSSPAYADSGHLVFARSNSLWAARFDLQRLDLPNIQSPHSWSPDGAYLAYYDIHPETKRDIWVLPLEGDPTPLPVAVTQFNERSPSFSPDGRWLAYVSDQSGGDQIYVQRFPSTEGPQIVSTDGGTEPIWSPKGGELFYRDGDRVMAVRIVTEPSLRAGSPTVLFESRMTLTPVPSGSQSWDVAPDGESFLMIQPSEGSVLNRIVVVENWFEELKRLVPTE